jgi:hypothetical protein
MLEAVLGAAVAISILFVLNRGRLTSGADHEVCWSCGQRNQHKLWCPNR